MNDHNIGFIKKMSEEDCPNEDCPYRPQVAMVTAEFGDLHRQIVLLTKERNSLKKENGMLKDKILQFEKGTNNRSIVQNETPDASESESPDLKIENQSPNRTQIRRGSKRERSYSNEDSGTDDHKKTKKMQQNQTEENNDSGLIFKCPQANCDDRFTSKKLCQQHQAHVHKMDDFCERCPQSFSSKTDGLKNHRKRHRKNDEKYLDKNGVKETGEMCPHCECV